MQSNRRLVVPQLGAFIAKSPGGPLLFSELLRRDDGVLRGLLRDGGMTDLEAAGVLDRFVFEVRHALQEGRDYPMEGLGLFSAGPEGTIRFEASPASPAGGAAGTAAADPHSATVSRPSDTETGMPAAKPQMPDGREERATRRAPDPAVKGLRYGRPQRTTDAYTYVGASPRRKRFGWWVMLLACAAAVLALGAIAYGYIRDREALSADRSAAEELLSVPAADTLSPLPDGEPVPEETPFETSR